jgi:hypothetical protein
VQRRRAHVHDPHGVPPHGMTVRSPTPAPRRAPALPALLAELAALRPRGASRPRAPVPNRLANPHPMSIHPPPPGKSRWLL